MAAAAIAVARLATSRFGTFTRESVSRVTRSCEKRTDADALTGPPSCSARLRRSACTFSGTSSSAPSPVSADTPSRVGVTSQLSTCRTVRVRKAPARSGRRPTPLQTARWNAVQKAKRRGLSIRRVAREVGIHRDTAKKYMEAVSPPMKLDRGGYEPSVIIASSTSDIFAGHLAGHFR